MPRQRSQTASYDAGSLIGPLDAQPRRILVIEDDLLVATTVEYVLQAAGHTVRATVHGKDIDRLLALFDPDLVITDIIMAEVDALEMIAKLRRSAPKIKIVAISGNRHLLTLAEKRGADHVLPKPFSAHQLDILINVALR
jgi:DNA-binding response OmpR family regulator